MENPNHNYGGYDIHSSWKIPTIIMEVMNHPQFMENPNHYYGGYDIHSSWKIPTIIMEVMTSTVHGKSQP